MSQDPHAAPAAEPQSVPADVTRSLFWDDVRAGLKVVCVGVILVLVGELTSKFHLHEFLVGAVVIVGGLLVLLGLGICTAIPKETGVRTLALGAAGAAGLGLLALVIDLFELAEGPPIIIAVVGAAVALVLLALVLRGCTTYLGHRPLTAAARSYVSVAAVFALFLVVVVSTGLVTWPAVRVLVDLLALGVVSILVYIAWGTSDAIVRVRQGQPLEAARMTLSPEQLALEELRRTRDDIVYTQPAQPHFSEADVRFFHADDARAAGTIVVLLTSIFCGGIVLYLIVAWSVAS